MNDLRIDWLRAFVAAVDGGSLSAATRVVHRSQAAVSMQLKKLELAVGAPVLLRDARRLELTPQGRRLLPHARRVLGAHQEAQAAVLQPGLSGQVCFGIPEDYAIGYLQRVLGAFSAGYPAVELTLVCAQSTALIPQVQEGAVDVAIVTQDRPGRGRLLFHEPLVWVASRSTEVWREDPLPVAIYEKGAVVRALTESALASSGRQYRLAYHSPSLVGQVVAAQSGLAVAVLARCAVPESLQVIDSRHGLPPLPPAPVAMIARPQQGRGAEARALQAQIVALLSAAA